MSIELVKIRASISVGGLTVKTPYIQSFNVRKNRGAASTFDAVLKVGLGDTSSATGEITIRAGEGSASNLIFTGIVKKIHITPCWDDPHYCFLNLSGTDMFYLLENKKYTRRCRASMTSWATIDSLVRPGLRSSKFTPKIQTLVMTPDLSSGTGDTPSGASYSTGGVTTSTVHSNASSNVQLRVYPQIA